MPRSLIIEECLFCLTEENWNLYISSPSIYFSYFLVKDFHGLSSPLVACKGCNLPKNVVGYDLRDLLFSINSMCLPDGTSGKESA